VAPDQMRVIIDLSMADLGRTKKVDTFCTVGRTAEVHFSRKTFPVLDKIKGTWDYLSSAFDNQMTPRAAVEIGSMPAAIESD
jgi:hypothetical protein